MRNIVISGSASGIGLACKERFEAMGDRVVGIDIRGMMMWVDGDTDAAIRPDRF